ncbi:Copper-exporting P-type ATPase A [bacterium HR08]|nr:Copper-exporting P-type ATPase A [bacterium HR08]
MREKITLGASLIGAIAASLCCTGPLVAALLGLGSFGAAAAFEAWRPYLLGVTAVLLLAAFYFTYRRPKVACAEGACATSEASRWSKLALWIAAGAVIALAAFPYYSGRLWAALGRHAGGPSASHAQAATGRIITARMAVTGMTCGGCATALEAALREISGVQLAAASYEKGEATVEYDPARVKLEKLVETVKETGFTVEAVTATIPVEGMTCAGCAVSVRQALLQRDGVKAVEVSVEKKHAVVTFDPARLTLEQVADAINKTGFKALL